MEFTICQVYTWSLYIYNSSFRKVMGLIEEILTGNSEENKLLLTHNPVMALTLAAELLKRISAGTKRKKNLHFF